MSGPTDDQITALLLPGLDGTGKLFSSFAQVLPERPLPRIVTYPTDQVMDYPQLEQIVKQQLPTGGPFVIIAESFSGPLALSLAADAPPGLRAVVLIASFVTNPALGKWRAMSFALNRYLFAVAPPVFAIRRWLVGSDASKELVAEVQQVVGSVKGAVIASRIRQVLNVDVTEACRRCPCPLLYLQAENDRSIREGIAEQILSLQPTATIQSIPGPHLLLQRHPSEVMVVVSDFLQSH